MTTEINISHVYSKVDPDVLLHLVIRTATTMEMGRREVIEPLNFLQLAAMAVESGRKFPPHSHLVREKSFLDFRAQESWVVLKGSVKVSYFDLDDAEISSEVLGPGDVSVTLLGGHGYEILEDSMVLEFKTGPYEGQAVDKRFL